MESLIALQKAKGQSWDIWSRLENANVGTPGRKTEWLSPLNSSLRRARLPLMPRPTLLVSRAPKLEGKFEEFETEKRRLACTQTSLWKEKKASRGKFELVEYWLVCVNYCFGENKPKLEFHKSNRFVDICKVMYIIVTIFASRKICFST